MGHRSGRRIGGVGATAVLVIVLAACEEDPGHPRSETVPTALFWLSVAAAILIGGLWRWNRVKPVVDGDLRRWPVIRGLLVMGPAWFVVWIVAFLVAAARDVVFGYEHPQTVLFTYGFAVGVLGWGAVITAPIAVLFCRLGQAIWHGRRRAIIGGVLLSALAFLGGVGLSQDVPMWTLSTPLYLVGTVGGVLLLVDGRRRRTGTDAAGHRLSAIGASVSDRC